MDESNLQTSASGYFSHSQIIKSTHILRVCERQFGALILTMTIWAMRVIMFLSVYSMSMSCFPYGGAYCKGMLTGTGALIEEITLNKNGGAYWNEVCTSS